MILDIVHMCVYSTISRYISRYMTLACGDFYALVTKKIRDVIPLVIILCPKLLRPMGFLKMCLIHVMIG